MIFSAFFFISSPSFAQQSAATNEYMAAMSKMDKAMQSADDPDAARAWAKKMIPHHQGSIDMGEIVLKNTKDPFVIKKSNKMIKNQKEEIKELQEWLSKK